MITYSGRYQKIHSLYKILELLWAVCLWLGCYYTQVNLITVREDKPGISWLYTGVDGDDFKLLYPSDQAVRNKKYSQIISQKLCKLSYIFMETQLHLEYITIYVQKPHIAFIIGKLVNVCQMWICAASKAAVVCLSKNLNPYSRYWLVWVTDLSVI